jgi:regulator of sigma E protease
MSVIIFILVLVFLILAHEFGHFVAAKATGMRVDEFGIGLPPKIIGWKPKKSETEYTLNWLPFGGFVRIWGEDAESMTDVKGPDAGRFFSARPKWAQIVTLVAGVGMNIIVAWLLLSAGFMTGLPMSISEAPAKASVVEHGMTIISVLPDSPAERAGFAPGDIILALTDTSEALQNPRTPEEVSGFIGARAGESIDVLLKREGQTMALSVTPERGIIAERGAIGISMDMVGTVTLGFFSSLWYGMQATGNLLVAITVGFWTLLSQIVHGTANLSAVSGPVGIASMFSSAASSGLGFALSFVAFISANLAVLNLLPFPALDGGRILFVIIEAIKRSPIKPVVANTLNTVGFLLLIGLMIAVTWQDIAKLLG